MIKNIIVISCIIIASIEVSKGQNNNDTNLVNEFDKIYTPPESSMLGCKLGEVESSSDPQTDKEYLLNLNASKLLRGYITFAIEYYLNKEFSVQARFNKNFMMDFAQTSSLFIFNEFRNGYNDHGGSSIIDQYDILIHDGSKSLSTYALGFSVRHYKILEYDNNEFYEFGIDYYNTKYAVSPPYSPMFTSFFFVGEGEIKQTHCFFNWGTQYESNKVANLTHEVYAGFGIKLYKYNEYEERMFNNVEYALKTDKIEESLFLTFQLGYILKIGL